MGAVDHISLVSGVVPAIIAAVAFGLLTVAAAKTWRRSLVVFGGVLVGLVVLARVIDIHSLVDDGFPKSFFVWVALPIVALSTRRRWLSAAAAFALVLFAASTINAFYDYRPTVGDVLGDPIASHGRLLTLVIPATVSRFRARPALVWLPPAYKARENWPVMMLMAGVPGDPTDMVRGGGAVRLADQYAAAHRGRAPIMVFPDHNGGFFKDTECVDGPRGESETYLTTDVPAYLESHFHATADGKRWAILGYSEGGTCAVTLALRHPETFGEFVDLAGDLQPNVAGASPHKPMTVRKLYGGDRRDWYEHDPLALIRHRRAHTVRAVFVAGSHDTRGKHHEIVLNAAARRAGLHSNYEQFPGGHNFRMVRRALRAWFPRVAIRISHAS